MEQLQGLTTAQYEIIHLLSCINSDEDVSELKSVIVQFLNSRLQKEIDRLWDNGSLTDAHVAAWQHEHMRTPYKHAQ